MTTIAVTLPKLHDGQNKVRHHPARFRVVAAGRRWRKTSLGVLLCTEVALRGGRAWWVAPTFPMASIGWRMQRKIVRQIPGVQKSESERRMTLPGGGWVQVKSAHDPDSLRGEGLDLVVFDECAFARERAWSEALRPALSDRQGKALFISTPKGRNWFWRLWQRGQGDNAEWRSWQFPTASNPYIDAAEIEAAQASLPERIFRQEYEAQFLEDAGSVFRNVMRCATAERRSKGRSVVFGVDWGKHEDWTVISVLDAASNEMIGFHRFNRIDYTFQTDRLRAWAKRYKPALILAEANAMGEPLIDQLQRDGLPVEGFTTTNQSKAEIVNALALALEQEEIRILSEPQLINELQAFEMTRLPSGKWRYSAPEGVHDDCVMSLALAWWAAQGSSGPAIIEI